jgi:hypothetical protein
MNIYSSNDKNASKIDVDLIWLWADDYFSGKKLSGISGASASDYAARDKTMTEFFAAASVPGKLTLNTTAWDDAGNPVALTITKAMIDQRNAAYMSRAATKAYIQPKLY